MSKDVNVNLCATEDEFNNFQANTVYQEEEFITLADILPEAQENKNVLECNKIDVPSVSDSNYDLPLVHFDSPTKVKTKQNSLSGSTSRISKKGKRKRGRPRKTNAIEPKLITHIASKKKKRGRPRSAKSHISYDISVNGNTSNYESLMSDISVCNQRKDNNIMNVVDLGEDVQEKLVKSKKKRGRKKKHSPEESSIQKEQVYKIDSSNLESNLTENEGDNISLSKLKETMDKKEVISNLQQNTDQLLSDNKISANVLNLEDESATLNQLENNKSPISDGNIEDTVATTNVIEDNLIKTRDTPIDSNQNEGLLVEDVSKRPQRRKVKKQFQYEVDSDEDPYTNIELSDDEPRNKRKGRRWNSDDEYIPTEDRRKKLSSDSESNVEDLGVEIKPKRKYRKKTDSSPSKPRKQRRKENSSEILEESQLNKPDNDLEVSLSSSFLNKSNDNQKSSNFSSLWASSNEFENFIAQKVQGTSLKIKKVTSTDSLQNAKPLEIPIIDPTAPKKFLEQFSQTDKIKTNDNGVQTSSPFEIKMINKLSLTSKQSQNACEFLKSIVKTTVELGQLLTEKSQDFMDKKINTDNITDTHKIDYCVKKSFLLFKLAKHNLSQMEEDLGKQYNEFLERNSLDSCREKIQTVQPQTKDNDSDCEIVEVSPDNSATVPKKNVNLPNPKTVFLNKELSIKIAKKPSETTKNITKGRSCIIQAKHSVWINENIMVKKVKSNQSFLAQDSRNKKPPDVVYVTNKMVSDFFRDYNRKKAIKTCAPFVSYSWMLFNPKVLSCYYFFIKSENFTSYSDNTNSVSIVKGLNISNNGPDAVLTSPKTLLSLCTKIIQNLLVEKVVYNSGDENAVLASPKTLLSLCTKVIQNLLLDKVVYNSGNENAVLASPKTLLSLCTKVIQNLRVEKVVYNSEDENYLPIEKKNPETLLKICLNYITNIACNENSKANNIIAPVVPKLQTMCFEKTKSLIYFHKYGSGKSNIEDDGFTLCPDNQDEYENAQILLKTNYYMKQSKLHSLKCSPLTLHELVFEKISKLFFSNWYHDRKNVAKVQSLADISFDFVSKYFGKGNTESENQRIPFMTINNVNTVSLETYQNLLVDSNTDNDFDSDDGANDYDNFNYDYENECIGTTENNWESQIQVEGLRSCNEIDSMHNLNVKEHRFQAENNSQLPAISHIKEEPVEDYLENDVIPTIVKVEHHATNEMTMVPDNIVTKIEYAEYINSSRELPQRLDRNSYNNDTFEDFSIQNTMSQADMAEMDEVFSQSALRVRRQHRPDSDDENDNNMSLLVPQTYEAMNIDSVKGRLMESSEEDTEVTKKNTTKKKNDKRNKSKNKKTDLKLSNTALLADKANANNKFKAKERDSSSNKSSTNQEPNVNTKCKEKEKPISEIAVLTRRMREKLKQVEEEKKQSSSSEIENIPLRLRKDKNMVQTSTVTSKETKKTTEPSYKEIQCNNVDSTEKTDETSEMYDESFMGFSAVDQNEISNYQKYVKFVYDAILPKQIESEPTESNKREQVEATITNSKHKEKCVDNINNSSDFELKPDERMKPLESEPTFSMMNETKSESKKEKKSAISVKPSTKEKFESNLNIREPLFLERNGWHCYPINNKDTKIYQNTIITLEKLPESFVETYFKYQNMETDNSEDEEVNRLTNLHSLNKIPACRDHTRSTKKKVVKTKTSETNHASVDCDPNNDCDEFSPSEEEDTNIKNKTPPPVAINQIENCLAKNLLMNDYESDDQGNLQVKVEPGEESVSKNKKADTKSTRSIKSKAKNEEPVEPESLMLTADKMMNKELNLLHAPVVLDDNAAPMPSTSGSKSKQKILPKRHAARYQTKNKSDDSSSEEEKQWVNTKEKLLKRMGNKSNNNIDDAKRAKLVSEFIERRAEVPESRSRKGGRRRSKKNLLEKQKQLRVLSKELTDESGMAGKAYNVFAKGRRNIRKVIDKKSLARSTVRANMDEFERKQRLNARQAKLREVLGCEEGVNLLVINDEVCLEYDFEEARPVVTVHAFFTKVMKAHQYEGVKFMWDACFESLSRVEGGHSGGGCILAHCMGLGKTLQVLALLHTVLTNPRTGMRRVLVCCPLSTVLNWVDEIHKWIGPVTDEIKVFELSKLKKTYERAYQLEDWFNGGGIFIIGYELFRSLTTLDPEFDDVRPTIINKIRTALLDPGPDIIICDEGHLLKNAGSILAVAMSRVVTKRRIVLTGTPMQNNLREYFCMVNFVKPNLLGTYTEYSNRFENPIMNGQHRDSSDEDIKLMKARTHILHKVLEGCLQRQEASVLYPYLPKKHEYTVFISLTKCQWELYKHYISTYVNSDNRKIFKDFHVLQKIWTHPQVLHSFQMKSRQEVIKDEKLEDDLAREDLAACEDIKPAETDVWWLQYLDGGSMLDSLESSNKFLVVFRILDQCVKLGDKVLIFSTSLITMDALEYFLKKINNWSLGQDYYRLDGSVPAEVRQKWCREFNAEHNVKTKLFLISTRAGCLGLNMTAANRVIILDTSWNPAHDIQSIFRVYRFGQKKDCYIYRLVALGTMEQKMYERSVMKQAVACRVVDEQLIDRHYNSAELNELYKFDDCGSGVAAGVAAGVRDVVLLRVARLAALYAVHEHDSLLRGTADQALPEHERAALWHQFQQEQASKQESDMIDKKPTTKHPLKRIYSSSVDATASTSRIKITAVNKAIDEDTTKPTLGLKSKKGKKSQEAISKTQLESGKSNLTNPPNVEEEKIKKITEILSKNNVYGTRRPKDVLNIIMGVRNVMALREVNTSYANNSLVQMIANVLVDKEEHTTPSIQNTDPPTVATNSSVEKQTKSRRKTAIESQKKIESILTASPDILDLNDDDYVVEYTDNSQDKVINTVTASNVKRKSKAKVKPKAKDVVESIDLLSDDDQLPDKIPDESSEAIPLHHSLLTNQNFIKIVAHTYLSGNPMLDEDAATLAAQYSTDQALKEIKSTGEKVTSGPIYDIAVKILGKDILKELNMSGNLNDSCFGNNINTNVSGKDDVEKTRKSLRKSTNNNDSKLNKVKEEPGDTSNQKTSVQSVRGPVVKSKVKLNVTPTTKAVQSSSVKSKPGPLRFKLNLNAATMSQPAEINKQVKRNVQQPTHSKIPPSVVPVGMFKLAQHTPIAKSSAVRDEECILPDDDDVHIITDTILPSTSNLVKPLLKSTATPSSTTVIGSVSPLSLPANQTVSALGITPVSCPVPVTGSISVSHPVSDHVPASSPVPIGGPIPIPRRVAMTHPVPVTGPIPAKNFVPRPARVPVRILPAPAPGNRTKNVSFKVVNSPAATPNDLIHDKQKQKVYNKINAQKVSVVNLRQSAGQSEQILSTINLDSDEDEGPVKGVLNTTSVTVAPTFTLLGNQLCVTSNPLSAPASAAAPPVPSTIVMSIQPSALPVYSVPLMSSATGVQSGTLTPAVPVGICTVGPDGKIVNLQKIVPNNMFQRPITQIGLESISASAVDDSKGKKNIVKKPQMENTTTDKTSKDINTKQKKAVCKPGDIIRIGKSGQLEFISRGEEETSINSSSTNEITSSFAASKTPADTHKETSRPASSETRSNEEKHTRKRLVSSSSSSSDVSEEEDPLSILRNVVHIQAPNAIETPKPGIKENLASKKCAPMSKTATKINVDVKKTLSKPDAAPSFAVLQSLLQTPNKNKETSLPEKKSLPETNNKPVPQTARKKTGNSSNPTCTIDLTELQGTATHSSQPHSTNSRSATKNPSKKIDHGSTIVGTSKNIIISGSGKASLATNKIINASKKKETSKINEEIKNISDVTNKRPIPPQTMPAKKKKTEHMTLKDFDIDDFDDIIELE